MSSLRERIKQKEEEKKGSSSSTNIETSGSLMDRIKAKEQSVIARREKEQFEREIDFTTFESDLQSMGSTISGIYNGWQTAETMAKTKTSVEAMQKRVNKYQTYQKKYGGRDISEIASGYESVLDQWDDLTSWYGNYKNADAFNTAKKKAQFDVDFADLTYDEVQAKKKEYAEDSDEYKYLSEYMNYSDLTDFDKALENASGDYKKNLQKASNQYELDHAFDRFKHYMDAEDFKEKSQYASTKSDDWHRGLTTQYGLGYEDVTYEYINDIDGMRSKIKDKRVVFGSDTGDTTPSEEKKCYDKLNADEIAVYNYIYQTEGKDKAQEYLDAMEVTLTKRVYDERTKTWKDNVDGVGGSIGMSALSVPMSILGGFTGAVESLGDKLQGKEYNPYGYYKQPTNFASDTRRYVGENIEESTDFDIFGQNIPRFLYDTGMSMADSAVGAMSLGRAYTPLMGMSAYQQKAKELTEAGEDADTIQKLAMANGLAEAVFEYISIDKLLKIKNVDSLGKFVSQTAKQMGIEASEEIFTETSNILMDKFIRGDESDLGQMKQDLISRGYSEEEAEKEVKKQALSQVGWAGVGGALSGGGMGGVVSASNYATNKGIGKQIRSNERVDEMWDMSALTPEVSEAYKAYTEYANKGINADNIKDAQLGNLYATVDSEARETLASKKSTEGQKVAAVSDLHKLSVIGTENTVSKRAKSLAQGEVTEVTATGNSAKIEGIKTDGEKTTLLTSEGEISVDDMTFTSNDAELVAYAETMSEENANLLLSQYDGQTNVSEYVDSFNLAVAYAENGFTSDSILENKGVLTNAQVSAIYKSVILNGVAKQQKAIDEVNAKHGKTMTIQGTFDDSVIDYNNATSDGSKVNWNSLTSTQRSAIKFAKGFSKATGANIRFVQSKVVDGKRVGKNGSYDAETNTIEIDVYAGVIDANTVKDSIIPTLSHEVTHWMKAKSPSMYNKMREHIMGTLVLDGKLTSEDRVASEVARMKAAHPDMKVTSEMAIDEIVARACEDMLSNSNTARKLLNQLSESEQKSFIGKVKETFDNLMQWVNDLLAQYKSNSKEAEILREYKHRLKQLSKMWDKALAEAIQTNQSLQKEGSAEEKVTQYSDREFANGIEQWAKEGMPGGEIFILGTTGDVLQGLGAIESDIYMNADKIKAILKDHNEISLEEIKKIPQILDNPVMVLKSKQGNSRLIMFGSVKAKNGKPILTVLDLRPHEKGFLLDDMQKVNSAYTKTGTHEKTAEENGMNFIRTSEILYLDKKRTTHLLSAIGFYMPITCNQSGYIGNISYEGQSVKLSGKPFFDVIIENANTKQYSDRNLRNIDNEYMSAVKKGDMITAQKEVDKVAKNNGYTIRSYHGTLAKDFTEFKKELIGSRFSFDEKGFFFINRKRIAEDYAASEFDSNKKGRILDVYLRVEKPLVVDTKFAMKNGLGNIFRDNDVIDVWDKYSSYLLEEAEIIKADGVIIDDNETKMTVVFEPNQIKSADAVTYDDHGNIIPLSKRFDFRNTDIRYSDRDSEGAQLTKSQIEFFKNSKVRDENGKLLVVYHGTRNADFTVFNRTHTYFTDSKDMADSYSPNGEGHKGYLNITNPFVVDSMGEKWSKVPIDAKMKVFLEEHGAGVFKEKGKWRTTPADIVYAIEDGIEEGTLDYDGVIIKNVDDTGSYGNKQGIVSNDYIAFHSNQFKNTDNLNPTEDADIRFSDREIIGSNGKSYGMGVYLDDNLLTGLSDSERIEMVKEFVVSELEGQHFIAYDNNGDAVDIGIAKKGDTIKNKNGKKRNVLKELHHKYIGKTIKQEAVVLIDELIANATYDSSKTPAYSHDWLDNYGKNDWDYWKVYIQEKNKTIWEATLNIANTSNGEKILYDIDPIKMVEEAIKSASTTTNDIVNPNDTKSQQQYSDRDNVSVYEAMGEEERLIAENQKLKEDIARLKGAISADEVPIRRFRSLADYLNKLSGSNMNREALGDLLEEVYTFIQTTDDLQWNDVVAKTYDIANSMMNRNMDVPINYFKEVMSQVRKDKVSLSAEQRAEAEKLFGGYGNFHRAMFGRVNIVNDGKPLAEMWQTWAKLYPSVFKEDVKGVDQVKALVDTVDTLKATSTLMGEYEKEEAIRHLATEVYNQFWNIASDSSEDVKKAKAEHRKMMEELRKEYEQRQKEKTLHPVGETALKYEKLLKKVAERDKAELKKAKALGKQRMLDYKERAARNTKIQSITQKALTLNKWLTKNSKDEHIHEALKGPVINLLQAIDFSSKQLLGMNGGSKSGTETQKDISLSKALRQVKDMMADANVGKEELVSLYGIDMDEDIKNLVDSVDNILRNVGDNAYVLNQMSLDDLKTLDKMVGAIKYAVTQMNKFHTVNHAKGIANLSQSTILEVDSLGKAKIHDGMHGWTDKLLKWGNALPYYAFKRFGEGGRKVYEAFQDGWDTFAFHVKGIIDYTNNAYTSKEVKEWGKDIKTFDVIVPVKDSDMENPDYVPEYQRVQMTVPQIMSLYCLQKREQAKGHMMGGGIRVADIKTKNGIVSQSDGVILGQDDIIKIVGLLTDRQIAVADALQEFMNTTCTDWGNEVSMLRFGYKAFGEENYFPIQSDKNNLAVNDETEQNNSLFRLLNMSFTKTTTEQANNRIVISDIFDVFAQHTSDMAKYNALALPVLDAFRWYNYKEKGQKGETQFITKSVKQSLEKAFGKDAQNYITTFLRDINGSENTSRDTVGKHFFSNAKIASVAANLRVAFLQPTSYLRASAVIDTKYLSKALLHTPKIGRAEKYCGIAQWKALGFYDTNIQRGVTSLIKHDETWKDKAVEKSMKGAEWGDKITWGYLWNACELEVRETQKNLKVGSDEFYTAIGKRLREVIYATQVVDSTMTRSQMMRSSDMYDKMLTSFASEPTLSYNMLQDAYMEWSLDARRTSKKEAYRKNRKKIFRVATAYTITNIVCAMVESGFDAYRDDEEEEMTLETFMKMYLSNFMMDMSITGKIPYIKEFASIAQGFTSSRTDTQWMQSFGYALKGITKIVTQGEGNVYSSFKNLLKGFSYVSGLPFYNAWRDSMSLLDKTNILTVEELEEMFNSMIE